MKSMYDRGVDPLNPEEASSGGMHFWGDASEAIEIFFGGGFRWNFQNLNKMAMKKSKYVKSQLWCGLS